MGRPLESSGTANSVQQPAGFALRAFPWLFATAFFCTIVQCGLVLRGVARSDAEILQRLDWDVAPHLANVLLARTTDGVPVEKAFSELAKTWLPIHGGSRLALVDSSGRTIRRAPVDGPEERYDVAALEIAVAGELPRLPLWLKVHSDSGADDVAIFSAAPVRIQGQLCYLVFRPAARLAGLPLQDLIRKFSPVMALSLLAWLLAASLPLLSFRWMSRSLTELTSHVHARNTNILGNPHGSLAHELASLRQSVLENQTELLRANAAVRTLDGERRSLLSRLLHDLQTPYTVLCGYVEMLASASAVESKKAILRSQAALKRIARFLDTLEDFTRRSDESGGETLAPLDLREAAEEATQDFLPVATAKKISLSLDVEGQDFSVVGERELIQRVIGNLLDNAIKFSPERSPVRMVVREVPAGIEISVRDRGIGIPEEALHRVGEEFFRAGANNPTGFDPGGTGLGLSNVKQFLARHGSKLTIESIPGEGTTVSFVLRRTVEQLPRKSLSDVSSEPVAESPLSASRQALWGIMFLCGIELIAVVSRVTVGQWHGIPASLIAFGALTTLSLFLLITRAPSGVVIGIIALASASTGYTLRFGMGVNALRDILLGVYLFATVLISFLVIRAKPLRQAVFLPLYASVVALELIQGTRTLALIILLASFCQLMIERSGDPRESRRLAVRTALGAWAILAAFSLPSIAMFSHLFEWAAIRSSRDASLAAEPHVAQLVREGSSPFSPLLLPLIVPDLSLTEVGQTVESGAYLKAKLGKHSPKGFLINRYPAASSELLVFGPSDELVTLANRVVQGQLVVVFVVSVIGAGALSALFLARWVQRSVVSRLDALSRISREPGRIQGFDEFIAKAPRRDEVTILAETLRAFFYEGQSLAEGLGRSIQRRNAMVSQFLQEVRPVLSRNERTLAQMEKAPSPRVLQNEAAELLHELREQALAVRNLLRFSRSDSTADFVGSSGPDDVTDTLMDLGSSFGDVQISGEEHLDGLMRIGLSPNSFRELMFHAASAAGAGESLTIDIDYVSQHRVRFSLHSRETEPGRGRFLSALMERYHRDFLEEMVDQSSGNIVLEEVGPRSLTISFGCNSDATPTQRESGR